MKYLNIQCVQSYTLSITQSETDYDDTSLIYNTLTYNTYNLIQSYDVHYLEMQYIQSYTISQCTIP